MTSALNNEATRPNKKRRLSGAAIIDLVGKTVSALSSCLPWTVERDELVQIGALAYLELEASYCEESGVPFLAFIHPRLRGRLIDHAWRAAGWSRSHFRTARKVAERDAAARTCSLDASTALHHINGQLQSAAVSLDILSDEAYEERGAILPIAEQPANPERAVTMRRQRQALRGALRRLPSDEAQILRSVYVEETSLKQVGVERGMSSSWACRTHRRLMEDLHEELTRHPEVSDDCEPVFGTPELAEVR